MLHPPELYGIEKAPVQTVVESAQFCHQLPFVEKKTPGVMIR
jgi:hypothetical protein